MSVAYGILCLPFPSQAAKKPIALLFTSAATVTPLYKALSTDFHKTVDFYAARDSKVGEEAMKAFGVEKVPALVVLDGDKVSKYEGASRRDEDEDGPRNDTANQSRCAQAPSSTTLFTRSSSLWRAVRRLNLRPGA